MNVRGSQDVLPWLAVPGSGFTFFRGSGTYFVDFVVHGKLYELLIDAVGDSDLVVRGKMRFSDACETDLV